MKKQQAGLKLFNFMRCQKLKDYIYAAFAEFPLVDAAAIPSCAK